MMPMKRILLALTMAVLLLPLPPRLQAEAEVTLNFFYDNLSPYGSWIDVGDYGYCFQPNVAVNNSDWRPYSDGYWAYTDAGWTWVSYEDFGWATYHYGRWANLDDYGWVWVPGYEWGPAWVSWRTGGDYVGWAPLPPNDNRVYEGRAITSQVDVEFGIGPLYYNFVDVRYIGEPVLRGRIFAPARNVTIINRTVNVTKITYNNSIVYNYGPNYNQLNRYSARPIQRLNLQRETSIGATPGQGGKGANLNRVNGNQLTVVAPRIQKSQQQIAPRQVKAKVAQPTIERGWQGVANPQQLQAEMKQENARNVAPPSFKPRRAEGSRGDLNQQNQSSTSDSEATGGNSPMPVRATAQEGAELQPPQAAKNAPPSSFKPHNPERQKSQQLQLQLQDANSGAQAPTPARPKPEKVERQQLGQNANRAADRAPESEAASVAAGQNGPVSTPIPQKQDHTGNFRTEIPSDGVQQGQRLPQARAIRAQQPQQAEEQQQGKQQPQGNKKKKKKPEDQPPDQQ